MTDSLLRQRYIAAGLIRPNTKELDPIQLNPGAIVFRINPVWGYAPSWVPSWVFEGIERCWH